MKRAVIPLLCLLLVSCRTVYVPQVVHDTLTVSKTEVAEVVLRDSVYIRETADTVYIYRERTAYRDRWMTDTIVEARAVPYPVETIREIPAELTRWQRFLMQAGIAGISALVAAVAMLIIKRRLR